MIDICDSVISILEDMVEDTDFIDIMEVTDVKFGDPGVVTIHEYPYIYVQPQTEESVGETITRRGYDIVNNLIEVGIVINQSDYFDETVSELSGLRELVKAGSFVRKTLRATENRGLGGIARSVKVPLINYEPQERGDAFTAVARISLIVQSQNQHEG